MLNLILIIGFYLLVSGATPFYCPVKLRFCVRSNSCIVVRFRPIFAINGFDENGFDENGFDKNGYDRNGYNRIGLNKNGLNKEGLTYQQAQEKKFYEEALAELNSSVTIANIVANDVAKELKQSDKLKFDAKQIAQLAKMIDEEIISSKIAKQVFEEMVNSGENPSKIVEDKGLVQITDVNIILPIIDEVMAKNPDNVAKYKAGNDKLFGFFVGQVLKATDGKANPKVVNDLVMEKLNS